MTISRREACDRFWELAGYKEPFPRSLDTAIALSVPLAIIRLPRLSPSSICKWLLRSGVDWTLSVPERPLSGCLVAHRGNGIVFLDGGMAAEEARFTVAHELAHFLLHYLWPREGALTRFGDSIRPVLDGERQASPAERLSGLLQGLELGPCSHLMDRCDRGLPDAHVMRLEAEADLLAFELLAPIHAVIPNSDAANREAVLRRKFGLPPWAARAWAEWINARTGESGLIEGLRAAAKKRVTACRTSPPGSEHRR